MSAPPPNDLLLKVTHLILTALLGLMLAGAVIVTLCIPIILFGSPTLLNRLSESGIGPDQLPWIVVLMALLVAILTLAFFFVRELRRIVATVSEGDPFVPVNADRLRHMAWLALAMQVLIIPGTGLFIWFDALPEKENVHYSDNNSFGGLILALLLFVLARVFRRGTEMRDEIEGTI